MSFLSAVTHSAAKVWTPCTRKVIRGATGVLALVLFAVLVLATQTLGFNSTSAQAQNTADPALWKISDADSEIWLFGTVHALNEKVRWRTAKIDQAFDAATIFYMEAPVNEATPEIMGPLMQKHGLNHSGKPFYDNLSPEGWRYFKAALKSLNIPESNIPMFAPMRPWLAAVQLVAFQMKSQGIDPEAGVDKTLWTDARDKGKQLGYLETLDQQFSIFGNLSDEEELAFFEASMEQMIEDSDMLDQLFNYWRQGQVDDLAELMNASFGADEKMKATLLTDRNLNWAYQIDSLMKGSGKIFIAVGAGHLGGHKSVQHFLEQMGYEVVRQ